MLSAKALASTLLLLLPGVVVVVVVVVGVVVSDEGMTGLALPGVRPL